MAIGAGVAGETTAPSPATRRRRPIEAINAKGKSHHCSGLSAAQALSGVSPFRIAAAIEKNQPVDGWTFAWAKSTGPAALATLTPRTTPPAKSSRRYLLRRAAPNVETPVPAVINPDPGVHGRGAEIAGALAGLVSLGAMNASLASLILSGICITVGPVEVKIDKLEVIGRG